MRKRSMLLLTGAVALVASLIVGPAATAKSDRQSAGTIIIGHDQEPVTLNFYITEGNAYTTSLAMNPVLASASVYDQNAKLQPFLVAGAPKIVKSDPLTVSFAYKPDREVERREADHRGRLHGHLPDDHEPELRHHLARRLGGHPEDHREGQERHGAVEEGQGVRRVGCSRRDVADACPQGRRAELQRPLADRRSTSRAVRSSGRAGRRARRWCSSRTRQFTAGPKAKVDRVVFRYIPSTPSLFQALNSGEIQVTEPQPQLQIVDIRKNTSKFKVQSGPGYFWEHMDIQFGPKGHPALKQRYIRQAIITGINRTQIKQALYVSPGLVGLGEGPARAAEPHLQALRAVLPAALGEVGVQPEQGHQHAEGQGLHRRPEQGFGQQQRHLELPERREAVVPLHDDHRQPASPADVRDRSEAAQERRHRAPAAVRPVGHRLRTGASLG